MKLHNNTNFVVVSRNHYGELTVNQFVHFESARFTYDRFTKMGRRAKLFAVSPAENVKVLMRDNENDLVS